MQSGDGGEAAGWRGRARRRLSLALIVACAWVCTCPLLLPSAHAGWIEDAPGKTVIHVKVWALPDPGDPATFARAESAGVKAFRERFPAIFRERWHDAYVAHPEKYGRHDWEHVEIALEKFSSIEVEGVENDLLAIAGGLAPDVLYLNFRKSDNYIQNRFLYPLDEYVATLSAEERDFRVNEKLWPVLRRKGPDGAVHTWAYPYGGALGKVLLYRKDLFDAHHLAYPTADYTWAQMLADAHAISDPGKGVYGFILGGGKDESWNWTSYLWSAGGEVMTYDEAQDQWRCVFDSRAAAVALDFYVRLCTEKWTDAQGKVRRGYASTDLDYQARSQKWDRGEIGMMAGYVSERLFATINPELTGMVPVPLGPGGGRGGELNSRMMGLYAEIAEPAVRDAAWEYLRFYDGEEAAAIKTRIMVEGGLGQFVNPAYLQRFGYPEIARLAPAGWSATFATAIATGRPEPCGRNSNLAYTLMTVPIQAAKERALADTLPADESARLDLLQGLLKDACARANEEMIGLVSPAERLKRRVLAWVVLAGLAVTFALVFRKVLRTFSPPVVGAGASGAASEIAGQRRAPGWRRYGWAYALLLPAVATILVWQYLPLLRGAGMAFFDYKLLGHSTWRGVDNFGDLLVENGWWLSVWNALRYSFLVLALTFIPPLLLAVALQEVPRGKMLFRLVYYLPAVITGLVTVLLWKQFFQPSEHGALNRLILHVPAIAFLALGALLLTACGMIAARLRAHELWRWSWVLWGVGLLLLGTCAAMTAPIFRPHGEAWGASLAHLLPRIFACTPEPYRWLSDPDTAMLACVIPMVWAGIGPGCLIYLAALKGIPDDYYEAADLDGATFIDKLLFIVLPSLKSLIIINFVGAFIASWYSATGNILVLTGGGANTETVGLHIWYRAFTFLKFGPATAMAWMLGFLLIGFTVHQLQMLAKVEFKTTGGKA